MLLCVELVNRTLKVKEICSFEPSLSTSRHDCVLSKRRCLPFDTTMFFWNIAVYQATRPCSFETSLSTIRHDYAPSKRRCLSADTTLLLRNVALYQPARLCSFETSLSTSRHDYVPSKRRCLPADTTMFFRNVAVYQSHHAACKSMWCMFSMSRISLSRHKSLPKYFRYKSHVMTSTVLCVVYSFQYSLFKSLRQFACPLSNS